MAMKKKLAKSREPLATTHRSETEKDDIFGFMKGKFDIVGDILSPIWEPVPATKKAAGSGRRRPSATKPRSK
jgi:hypothetical protein